MRHMITADELRYILTYDYITGEFRWRVSRYGRGCKKGNLAGRPTEKGYWRITIDGVTYRAHRLAWLYMMGSWPIDQIDHINGEESDNRWSNLRAATGSQNQSNRGVQANSLSGIKGVFWDAERGKWAAKIKKNGKTYNLGRYGSGEDAKSAYDRAASELHGEFARVA